MSKYKCTVCDYIYDPGACGPEDNMTRATTFANLPANWACPECEAGKEDFELIELKLTDFLSGLSGHRE
jgi:rubredoxin